jgi:hypothetical protein
MRELRPGETVEIPFEYKSEGWGFYFRNPYSHPVTFRISMEDDLRWHAFVTRVEVTNAKPTETQA